MSQLLEQTLEIAERLIRFDTESSKSNLALVDAVENYFKSFGVACLRAPNAQGDKQALLATIGPMVYGGVVLSGHSDVVPVEGQAWSKNPFSPWRENDRLYGRGACDMKGFDACCLAMAPLWARMELKRPIHILISYDEEVSCEGSLDIIRRFGVDLVRPAAVIVGEPTMMRVANAHKSVNTYWTRIRGAESHSAQIDHGVSAIHVGLELANALLEIGKEFRSEPETPSRFDPPFSTVHIGMIQGGTARNILARDCHFHWEFRGLPHAPARAAYDRFQAVCARVASQNFQKFPNGFIDTQIEVEVPPLSPDPGSFAQTLGFRLARENNAIAVPFATEAGQFQRFGLPTIVCGPGDIAQAHQPDEFISFEQLRQCLAFLQRLGEELS